MKSLPKCPKCQNRMEKGYIMDRGDANRIRPATWVEGELVRSWWMGAKLAGKRQLQVDTFRCIGCGYVESYTC